MALNAKQVKQATKKGPQQPNIEAGTYPARLVQVIDLGVQEQRPYKNEPKAPAHEVMFTYEFLDEFCVDEQGDIDEEKPRWLSETFPFRSLEQDLATSTKRYKALDPNDEHDGDFLALVGSPCMLTIVNNPGKGQHAGKVFDNIASVSTMRPKEAAKAAELVNPPKTFSLDEPDLEIFKSLPEWLQDKIKGNLEFEGSALQEALEGTQEKPKPKGKGKPQVEEEDDTEEPVDEEGEPW